jgi:hypothetical protein
MMRERHLIRLASLTSATFLSGTATMAGRQPRARIYPARERRRTPRPILHTAPRGT